MTVISAIHNLHDDEVDKTCTIVDGLPVRKLFESQLEVYQDPVVEIPPSVQRSQSDSVVPVQEL